MEGPDEPEAAIPGEIEPVHAEEDAVAPVETTTKDDSLLTVDQARDRLESKLQHSSISIEDNKDALLFDSIQLILKDHDHLKEKVGKLKSLLGRSAKAQRETKVEMDATQKRLDQALAEVQKLQQKMEKLSNRPSHMELLADFEANFDRALLSVGLQQSPSSASTENPVEPKEAVVDSLLMKEMAEAKHRIEKLEKLNATLAARSAQLEVVLSEQVRQCQDWHQKVTHLELEKRMAVLEADTATKELQRKVVELQDMQMELDLVTKASVRANAMAAVGEEIRKKEKAERQQIQQLEAKVQALQEWALASSAAKSLAQEQVRVLEQQVRALQRSTNGHSSKEEERQLFKDHGSFVIGAGEMAVRVFTLTSEQIKLVRLSDRVVLRWHFDLTSPEATLPFHLIRGACETPASRQGDDYIIHNRMVQGGAEGEADNAFTHQRACTIVWDNSSSWIRPKTVKYTVEAIVVEDD
ncbi:hypothetical protein FisN_3Lh552 [Fistulifera solaris]|uniref:GOLD domain-containing protein n=1 Tax=Fistulifera solaris TaxID=1519565 RepID=A0A1Z5J8P2_FISSO|nr:hypothetical protein FisN_3Lh552 [Fistulifera solaris]|eukprot:GAX10345.1 hypothetical protein FisN_3Lh552 [Fistulifera solaris]